MNTWIELGFLDGSNTEFSDYRKDIGLYQAVLNNEIVYIGKATELKNGGFRKRLRDYTRDSNSARNYPSGIKMYQNKSDIIIKILIVERSNTGVKNAEILETKFIKEFRPEWNLLDNIEKHI